MIDSPPIPTTDELPPTTFRTTASFAHPVTFPTCETLLLKFSRLKDDIQASVRAIWEQSAARTSGASSGATREAMAEGGDREYSVDQISELIMRRKRTGTKA